MVSIDIKLIYGIIEIAFGAGMGCQLLRCLKGRSDMPGRTLLGEALTFEHDEQLVGYCLNNSDEPVGDSFEDRCKPNNWTPIDEVVMPEDEVQNSLFGMFCQLSVEAQEKVIDGMKTMIVGWLGLCQYFWEPSTEFVLDCIQDGLSEDEIRKLAHKVYLSAHDPMEFNPSDVEYFDHGGEDNIVVSQAGGHISRKPAIYQEENGNEAREWRIHRNSHERFRARDNEFRNRRIHLRDGRHTIRKETEKYFVSVGIGDENVKFIEPIPAVDEYGALYEPWWANEVFLDEALLEERWLETQIMLDPAGLRASESWWTKESSSGY